MPTALALFFGLSLIGCGKAPSPVSESLGSVEMSEAALAGASSWLAIVDEGKYEESWDRASEAFRANMARFGMDEEEWVESLGVSRKPLGAVRSRVPSKVEEGGGMPGGPEGRYVQIVYDTGFEHSEKARETVVMRLDPDGAWRMFNYTIERGALSR